MDVEAKVIETDLTALSKTEEWLAQTYERAEAVAEQYKPHPIVGEQDYKDSKKARADANREIAAIEQERKNMTSAIKKVVRDFEGEAKKALAPLYAIVGEYDEHRRDYEATWLSERTTELAREYEDTAPNLVPLVPFDLLLSRYGRERGKVWTNRSTNIEAAKSMMADAIYDIAESEKAIDSLVPEEDRTEVKAHYFQSLDLNAALAEARRIKEQRERVRQMEAERLAWESQAQGEPEPEPVVADPQPVVEPEPTPAPQQDVPHAWVIIVSSATKAQMLQHRNYARSNSIPFDCIYSGTLQEVYERVTNAASSA